MCWLTAAWDGWAASASSAELLAITSGGCGADPLAASMRCGCERCAWSRRWLCAWCEGARLLALPSARKDLPPSKASVDVMPSTATADGLVARVVLVTLAASALRVRLDDVVLAEGAEASAVIRLGAMVMVMSFSLSSVSRWQ
ncbi:hypothetical protein RB25_11885 [Herbaspirillum rubrisubalbicans]|nr:hypothetical protein RB25_11885 [Herbaspirillum rubrisubalbicans]